MEISTESAENSPGLVRGMGLGSATALNMIDMIGVGPFVTMPLVLSAMGGPHPLRDRSVGGYDLDPRLRVRPLQRLPDGRPLSLR